MKRYLLFLAIAGCAAVTPVFADNCPTTANWCSGPYLYDGSGNIRAIGSDTYVYDQLERLKSGTAEAQRGGTSRQDYTYDSFGNRTGASRVTGSVDCLGGCEQSPTIDLGTNHITGSGAAYDNAGNLLSIQSTVNGTTFSSTYTYDAAGLTRATAGTDDRQFIYTAEGERIATRNGQTWTWTVRGLDNKVLREFSSLEPNGQPGLPTTNRLWTKDYVWRDGQLLASVTTSSGTPTTQHFHLDHLGTPRLVTNDSGAQIGIHAYYPFGAEMNLGPDVPSGELIKFTGHERDLLASNPNTLDYLHARFDSTTVGRFQSVDPELDQKAAPYNPQKWNRFAYVVNNPIFYRDPSGKQEAAGFSMDRDVHDLLAHRITEQQYWSRLNARGTGAAIGGAFWGAVLFGPESLAGAARWGRAAVAAVGGWLGFGQSLSDGPPREMLSEAIGIVRNTEGTMAEKADLLEGFTQQIEKSAGGVAEGWTAARLSATDGSQLFLGSQGRFIAIGADGQMGVGQLGAALQIAKDGSFVVYWDMLKIITGI